MSGLAASGRLLIDDDQDCILLQVQIDGGARVMLATGFFRALKQCNSETDFSLEFIEKEKVTLKSIKLRRTVHHYRKGIPTGLYAEV